LVVEYIQPDIAEGVLEVTPIIQIRYLSFPGRSQKPRAIGILYRETAPNALAIPHKAGTAASQKPFMD